MTTEEPPARRSDATRAAIVDAARRRFAIDGFRKATIRAIAADAGIDPAMVMRYYGSKDNLFAVAVNIELGLPDLGAADPGALGEALTRHFLKLWEQPPTSETLLTLLRSAVTDEATVAKFQQVFAEQVTPAVLRFGDQGDAPRRAGLVVCQLLGLALCRYVLRLPPVVAMTNDQILADVAPTIQRYLAGGTGPRPTNSIYRDEAGNAPKPDEPSERSPGPPGNRPCCHGREICGESLGLYRPDDGR